MHPFLLIYRMTGSMWPPSPITHLLGATLVLEGDFFIMVVHVDLILAETTRSPILCGLRSIEQHDEEKNDGNKDEGDGFNYITYYNNN